MKVRFPRSPRRFGREKTGGITVIFALATPVVLGFVALAVETGLWYQTRREMQSAADAAAMAGAFEILYSSTGTVTSAATAAATRNGFQAVSPSTIVVNHPPTSGNYIGDTNAVEVIVNRYESRLFTTLFQSGNVLVKTRAVAKLVPKGDACILALDTLAADAAESTGTVTITADECLIAANSSAADAVKFWGNATVDIEGVWSVGGYVSGGSAVTSFDQPPFTYAPPIPDPYEGLGIPTFSGCDHTNFSMNSSGTISPGVYCKGMKFTGNTAILVEPGTYIIDRDDLSISAGTVMTCPTCILGEGVTFILTTSESDMSKIGRVTVNGGATIALDAPQDATNPYNGVLLYQDRRAPTSGTNKFNGGATMSLGGAIYFPQQEVQFSGNNAVNLVKCTHIVGRLVTMTGTAGLDNSGCTAAGWTKVQAWAVDLKE